MKRILSLCLLFFTLFMNAQTVIGDWKGNIKTPAFELPIIFHITKTGENYFSSFDSPNQGAMGIKFDTTKVDKNDVELKYTAASILFKGKLTDGKIIGTFQQNGMDIPLELERMTGSEIAKRPQTPQPPFEYTSTELKIKNEVQGNILAGTLVTPKDAKENFPIVVMITGSGAQDRNETLFNHQPFFVLSDYLARQGIGSLRMDDRGVGESEIGKEDPTTADFATDISSAVNFLKNRGYTNIGLLGHSEGGMIAPMVANENSNVRFQILLAAPGVQIKELMLLQNKKMMKGYGLSDETIKANNKKNELIYDFIINYKGNDFKNDFKQWSTKNLDSEINESELNTLSSKWFRYFIRFNPEEYLAKIKVPTLAINGSLDSQVTSKENLGGIMDHLEINENSKNKVIEFKGLNHLFQTAETGSPLNYGKIEETISPKVLKTIAKWINAL